MKYLLSLFTFLMLVSCVTPRQNQYSKIEYEAGPCFGFCPMFKMTINADRTAVVEAEHFTFSKNNSKDGINGPKEGIFIATIKKEDYDKLLSLFQAANLKSLNNFYGNKNITDLPTAHLKIDYADGTSKHIEDYGKGGTEKLDAIYQFIEGLIKTQNWTKTK